jgi:glutamyl-tRNA synthetase
VIRGDDHVNNTPRQINIFRALGLRAAGVRAPAHRAERAGREDEQAQRRQAVTQYRDEGYLADAVVNYLARLGWSHGDDEIFSREQFLQWFNLDHLGKSAAQFDDAKLRWVNAQHMKAMDDEALALLVSPAAQARRHARRAPAAHLRPVQGPLRHHAGAGRLGLSASTCDVQPNADEAAKHITDGVRPAISMLAKMLEGAPGPRKRSPRPSRKCCAPPA